MESLALPAPAPNATTLPRKAPPRFVAPIVDVSARIIPKIAETAFHTAPTDGGGGGSGDGEIHRAGADHSAQQQAGREQAGANPSIFDDQFLDFVFGNVFVFDFVIEKLVVFSDLEFASHGISNDFGRERRTVRPAPEAI